ncbi:hypothetical protein [Mycoplasma todarodis]|uniref:hypothetical protein n=1 Tax=Mycoplasma todarodis TaxID=1937191 RepID=UPI003B51432D
MRAIIYGHDIETKEWVELLNKGGFWAFMNGMPFMVKRAIRLSKKHKVRTYLSLQRKSGTVAILPLNFKTTYNLSFVTHSSDYEQASEWRIRKTIPELILFGDEQRYWTKHYQFFPPTILSLNAMDIFIEHWDSFDHQHIKTTVDFVMNAVSEIDDERVFYEAQWIMEDRDIFNEFYEELKPLGIKKGTYRKASKEYFDFLDKMIEENS